VRFALGQPFRHAEYTPLNTHSTGAPHKDLPLRIAIKQRIENNGTALPID
jgi:hypothetical protein